MTNWQSQRSIFLRHIAQTSEFPLAINIQDSQGIYIIDEKGNKIIDMICGISVSALGHNHPQIKAAVHEQVDKFMHTMVYGEFVITPQVLLAKKIVDLLPAHLNNVYFLNSGTEAVEGALKLAIKHTGRKKIIAASNAYHGSTMGAMSLMTDMTRVESFGGPTLDVEHIEYNNIADLEKITSDFACVIMETIQAESGIHWASIDYMRALRQKCTEKNCLLIFDEIQAGMGRTGRMFAFEHYGISPDILLLAKAFGGGMPLSAFISDKSILDSFSSNPILGHITTFGGHPVSCAAGLASLELICKDELWKKADTLGEQLDILQEHPVVKDYRRFGFWAALDVGSMDLVLKIVEGCLKEGLLIDWFLFNDHSLRICPPLTMTSDELRVSIDIISCVLDQCRF